MTHLRRSLSQFQLPIQNFQANDDYNQSVEDIRDREYPMLKGKQCSDKKIAEVADWSRAKREDIPRSCRDDTLCQVAN